MITVEPTDNNRFIIRWDGEYLQSMSLEDLIELQQDVNTAVTDHFIKTIDWTGGNNKQ